MQRRDFISLIGMTALTSGCSNSAAFKTINSAFDSSFGNPSSFDPDYPDRLPYASIAVKTGNSPKALLVLGKSEADELHWQSADKALLVTQNGILVRTAGFRENLIRTTHIDSTKLSSGKRQRIIDLSPSRHYGVRIDLELVATRTEEIQIGHRTYITSRYSEYGTSKLLRWNFVNEYWQDESGFIWRSTQYFHPQHPPLTIEITKPFLPDKTNT